MEGNQSDLTRDEASVAESVAEIQALMLDWINVKPGPEAKSVWVRIEEKLVALATAQVAAVSDQVATKSATPNRHAAGCGDGEDCRTCDALGLDPALYPRTEAATTAPIYQERTANGLWQDVSKELHHSIVAGRVRSEGVRIVYAEPSLAASSAATVSDAAVVLTPEQITDIRRAAVVIRENSYPCPDKPHSNWALADRIDAIIRKAGG